MKPSDSKPGRVPLIETSDEQIVFVIPIGAREDVGRTLTIRCERSGEIYLSLGARRTND